LDILLAQSAPLRSGVVATRPDLAFQFRFVEEYAHEPSVLADAMAAAPLGLFYNGHNLVGGDALKRTRF
jgi:hypothetical protein